MEHFLLFVIYSWKPHLLQYPRFAEHQPKDQQLPVHQKYKRQLLQTAISLALEAYRYVLALPFQHVCQC